MNEDQAAELIRTLKNIDWKLWEMYNMMKAVLVDEDTIEKQQEQDDND